VSAHVLTRLLVGALAASWWAAGCGSNDEDDEPGSGSGPIASEDMPAAVAHAICGKVESCECRWGDNRLCTDLPGCPGSRSACIDQVADFYASLAEANSRLDGVVYDSHRGRSCIDTIDAASCDDVDYTEICAAAWQGTLPLGATCTSARQCEGSYDLGVRCETQCVAAETYQTEPGAACDRTCRFVEGLDNPLCVIDANATGDAACYYGDGYRCFEGSCVPLGAVGDACAGNYQCVDGSACIQGVCSARIELGEFCSADAVGNPCVSGAYCDGLRCVAQVELAEACTVPEACASGSCLGDVCTVPGAQPLCVRE
jgi:hypothetical protein